MKHQSHTLRLKNGLTVLFTQTPGIHTVYLDLLIQSGSRHEPRRKQGLSHLVEHLAARAAQRSIPDNALEDHYLSHHYNAETNDKHHLYTLSGHKDDMRLMVRMIGCALNSRNMKASDIRAEVPRILSEIRQDLGDDEIVHHADVRKAVFGQKHPLGVRQAGNPRHLKTMTLKDVKQFMSYAVQPERAHLKVVGDLKPESVTRLLNAELAFDAPKPMPTELHEPKRQSLCVKRGLSERHITHAWLIPQLPLKAEITTDLLLPLLQAYLHKRVAEPLGLYHVSANVTYYRDCCLLDIYTSVPKTQATRYKKALAQALKQFPRSVTEARLKKERVERKKIAEINEDHFTRLSENTGWYYLVHGTTLLPGQASERLIKKTTSDLKRAFHRFTDTAPCIVETY